MYLFASSPSICAHSYAAYNSKQLDFLILSYTVYPQYLSLYASILFIF